MKHETATKLLDAYRQLCDTNALIPASKSTQPLLKRVREGIAEASETLKEAIASALDDPEGAGE